MEPTMGILAETHDLTDLFRNQVDAMRRTANDIDNGHSRISALAHSIATARTVPEQAKFIGDLYEIIRRVHDQLQLNREDISPQRVAIRNRLNAIRRHLGELQARIDPPDSDYQDDDEPV